jgi:hypothetical protein
MRRLWFTVLLAALTAGCAPGSEEGAPSAAEIQQVLETKYRTDLQEMVDWMGSMRGEQGRQAALAAEGVSDPSEIAVLDLKVDQMRALSNGDFRATVLYRKRNGSDEQHKSARVTLTQVKGRWRVVGMDIL